MNMVRTVLGSQVYEDLFEKKLYEHPDSMETFQVFTKARQRGSGEGSNGFFAHHPLLNIGEFKELIQLCNDISAHTKLHNDAFGTFYNVVIVQGGIKQKLQPIYDDYVKAYRTYQKVTDNPYQGIATMAQAYVTALCKIAAVLDAELCNTGKITELYRTILHKKSFEVGDKRDSGFNGVQRHNLNRRPFKVPMDKMSIATLQEFNKVRTEFRADKSLLPFVALMRNGKLVTTGFHNRGTKFNWSDSSALAVKCVIDNELKDCKYLYSTNAVSKEVHAEFVNTGDGTGTFIGLIPWVKLPTNTDADNVDEDALLKAAEKELKKFTNAQFLTATTDKNFEDDSWSLKGYLKQALDME